MNEQEYHYRELNYSDILLIPNYSEVSSRKDVDTSIEFGPMKFKLPVVPANMKTVINDSIAIWLASNGYFYIMHRFSIDTVEFCKLMQKHGLYSSISVGVNPDSYEVLNKLFHLGIKPLYICIDVAHGHTLKMKKMIKEIRSRFDSFIIAGNVVTPQAVEDLESWGANSIKVGIGGGSPCSTKLVTGFSRPQFSAVLECAQVAKTKVIADGSIKTVGDIAKALVAKASMVMCGKLLAGLEDSPGQIYLRNGIPHKDYFGSASEFNKDDKNYVEGNKLEIPCHGTISSRYKEIEQGVRSSISYAGGNDLSAFLKTNWVRV